MLIDEAYEPLLDSPENNAKFISKYINAVTKLPHEILLDYSYIYQLDIIAIHQSYLHIRYIRNNDILVEMRVNVGKTLANNTTQLLDYLNKNHIVAVSYIQDKVNDVIKENISKS